MLGGSGSRPRKSRPGELRSICWHNETRPGRSGDDKTGEVTVFYLKYVEAKEAARIVRQFLAEW